MNQICLNKFLQLTNRFVYVFCFALRERPKYYILQRLQFTHVRSHTRKLLAIWKMLAIENKMKGG